MANGNPCTKTYSTLRYVDSVTAVTSQRSYLFRGGSPVAGPAPGGCPEWTFDYSGLTNAITAVEPPSPIPPVQSPFYLIDVSLLSWSGPSWSYGNDPNEVNTELQYFVNNPMDGEMHWWPTFGVPGPSAPAAPAPPACVHQTPPGELAGFLATLDQWFPEPLDWRVAQLRTWLQSPPANANGRPLVIYVHCDGGCDRTGEMIGAYMLRYMGMNWAAMYANNHPCVLSDGTPWYPGCGNYQALQWYAFWLNTQSFGLDPITGIGNDCGCKGPDGIVQMCPEPAVLD